VVLLFVTGILVGTVIQTTSRKARRSAAVRLNHVAISVPDVSQAMTWYGEKLGFHEVVRNTNPQGQLMAAYIQVTGHLHRVVSRRMAQRPRWTQSLRIGGAGHQEHRATFRQRRPDGQRSGAPSAFTGRYPCEHHRPERRPHRS